MLLKSIARTLRKNMTLAERTLWRALRLKQFKGLKFRRQFPIEKYIVDFVCLEKKLIIEIDGGQHSQNVEKDAERTKWLEEQGFYVLRFWNNDVLKNPEAVKMSIWKALSNTPT